MPSAKYEKNKENIARWREENKEKFLELARKAAKTYYAKNAELIRLKKKQWYKEKKMLSLKANE